MLPGPLSVLSSLLSVPCPLCFLSVIRSPVVQRVYEVLVPVSAFYAGIGAPEGEAMCAAIIFLRNIVRCINYVAFLIGCIFDPLSVCPLNFSFSERGCRGRGRQRPSQHQGWTGGGRPGTCLPSKVTAYFVLISCLVGIFYLPSFSFLSSLHLFLLHGILNFVPPFRSFLSSPERRRSIHLANKRFHYFRPVPSCPVPSCPVLFLSCPVLSC